MIFVAGLALLAAATGIWLSLKFREASPEHRAYLFLMPCLLAALLIPALVLSVKGAFLNLSAAKLAPTFALFYGYDLFYGPDAGPILNTIYGPLAYLIYLPATLAETPTGALLIADSIAVTLYFLPLALFIVYANRGNTGATRLLVPGLAFAFVVAVTYSNTTTRIIASQVHNNAPAVGLALLSCLALMRMQQADTRTLTIAAFLAAAAVWVKQTEAPVVIAQGLFLYLGWGRQVLVRYWSLCVAWGAGMGVLFAALFGLEPMLFNMFQIPGNHELRADMDSILRSLNIQLNDSLIPLAIIVAAWGTAGRRTGKSVRNWIKTESWTLPAIVAVVIAPTCMLGHLKIGGYLNNLHSEYFLLAAAAGALTQLAGSGSLSRRPGMALRALALVAVFSTAMLVREVPRPGEALSLMRGNNPPQEAFDYAREHPGKVYFPWLPLASLMAEGKFYHFDFGITDRTRANVETSAEHYRQHLPPDMQYLAIQKYGGLRSPLFDVKETSLSYTQYTEVIGELTETELAGLKNFRVWRRDLTTE